MLLELRRRRIQLGRVPLQLAGGGLRGRRVATRAAAVELLLAESDYVIAGQLLVEDVESGRCVWLLVGAIVF